MPRAAHSPIIAITMGDPAGIGPEIVAKTLAAGLPVPCRPVLVADPEVMERAARTAGTRLRFRPVADLSEAAFQPGEVAAIQPEGLEVRRVHHGRVDAAAGKASPPDGLTGDGVALVPVEGGEGRPARGQVAGGKVEVEEAVGIMAVYNVSGCDGRPGCAPGGQPVCAGNPVDGERPELFLGWVISSNSLS